MTEGDALLQDIIDNPSDDGLRLIYADWLEEVRGEAERAEFIRVQCELARRGGRCLKRPLASEDAVPLSMCCVVCDLRISSSRLSREGYPQRGWIWAGEPLNRIPDASYTYRRGFVHTVRCPLSAWHDAEANACTQAARDVCRLHPVERVEIVGAEPIHSYESWNWWGVPEGSREPNPASGDIPQAIWRHMPPAGQLITAIDNVWSHIKSFDTREDALDALSRACILHARGLIPTATPAV